MKRILRKIKSLVTGGAKGGGFAGSANYWEERYKGGGDSGVGSYGKFAEFKAEVLNRIVADNGIRSVIEFGCGDGNQLKTTPYPDYLGFDVSNAAVARCHATFAGDATKRFKLVSEFAGETADLTLSLDVIYHLVEDAVFADYMARLFGASRKFVVIYSSDSDDPRTYAGTHVRPRSFSAWIAAKAPEFRLLERIPNRYPYRGDYKDGSWSDFFVYARVPTNEH